MSCEALARRTGTRLTLPPIAPPLRDGVGVTKGSRQIVMRPLMRQREFCLSVERHEWELCQENAVDLYEELLPHSWIRRRLFLDKQLVQCRVAVCIIVEVN
jgi:hypothetical protein